MSSDLYVLSSCLPFWVLLLSILLNAVSLGRLPRQLISSLCGLDRE